ncbi:hypothetical protein [Streptomyces sp. NPDC007205]|uniref:hypothetical protein n=1 Tax=Streptomyces sp. NPDC007205 TaxID=3154316 RepID=UPI0033CCDB74
MTDTTGIDAAEAAARSLLDTRLEPIRDLAAAREDIRAALDQLTAAVQSYAAAHTASTAVGWSGAELRKLDYDDPTKLAEIASKTVTQATGRKAARSNSTASRTRTQKTNGQAPGSSLDCGSPAGSIPTQDRSSVADGATLGAASS